jgi:hypothetical protein
MKHRSSCNVLRPMDRVFMGKISTFCPVNWNKLKNSYHYEIMQTSRGQHIFLIHNLQFCKFHEGLNRGIHAARAKCTFSTIFSSFTILYYTPMYYEVNLNNGATYIGKISM